MFITLASFVFEHSYCQALIVLLSDVADITVFILSKEEAPLHRIFIKVVPSIKIRVPRGKRYGLLFIGHALHSKLLAAAWRVQSLQIVACLLFMALIVSQVFSGRVAQLTNFVSFDTVSFMLSKRHKRR